MRRPSLDEIARHEESLRSSSPASPPASDAPAETRCANCFQPESAHVTTTGAPGIMCPPPATFGTFTRPRRDSWQGVDLPPEPRPAPPAVSPSPPVRPGETAMTDEEWHREVDRLFHLVDLAANHTAYRYVHSDAARAREFLTRLRTLTASAATLREAATPLFERIVCQWDELQAGRVEGGIFLNRVQAKEIEALRAALRASSPPET